MVLTKNNIEKLEGLFLNHLKTSKITEVICMHGNRKIRHVLILDESDSE